MLAWTRPALRLPAAIACAALPVAWYAQYQGGADPQWGGRYLLLSGALLAVAGVRRAAGPQTGVGRGRRARGARRPLGGVGWLSVRSHTVADGMATILARHDELLISRQPHMLREGGAFYDRSAHWLTATDDRELAGPVAVAREAGVAGVRADRRRRPTGAGQPRRVRPGRS